MTPGDNRKNELVELVDRLCNGELEPAGMARLNSLLEEDDALLQYYVECLDIESQLLCEPAGLAAQSADATDPALSETMAIPAVALPETPLLFPTHAPLGDAAHNTFNFFSSGWPAAYLIAAVICGVGLTLAAFTYVSQPTEFANQRHSSNPQSPIPNPSAIVARITGTADCRWEKKVASGEWRVARDGREERGEGRVQSQPRNPLLTTNHKPLTTPHKSLVCLGDQFILSAGLMEITYNTGAIVILQGPCTYEVDSAAGGFLSVGKLTARVEQSTKYGVRSTEKMASGQWRVASDKIQNEKCKLQNAKLGVASESSLTTNHYPLTTNSNPEIPKSPNPSPLSSLLSPLFAVRTPTATITDLGTEFGVEVDEQGGTTSHVFQGSVRVQTVSADGKTLPEARILRENESVRVERRDDADPIVAHQTFKPSDIRDFIRELPKPKKPLPLQVVAHFRLGEDDPGAQAGQPVGPRTFSLGKSRHLETQGAHVYTSETAAPGSSLAVSVSGAADEGFVSSRLPFNVNDYFILEAWCRASKIEDHTQIIVYNGHPAQNGFGLIVKDGTWQFMFGGIICGDSGVPCTPGKWTHLALVCERGEARLWVDGQPVGETYQGIPTIPDSSFAIGFHPTNPPQVFSGQIDEVRLSTFLAPFRSEMLLLPKAQMKSQ